LNRVARCRVNQAFLAGNATVNSPQDRMNQTQ
jgi:hypothetical protein